MPAVRWLLVLLVAAALGPARTAAQEPDAAELDIGETDSDPTRPVLFSLRPEFYSIRDRVEQRVVIFRYDAAFRQPARLLHSPPGVVVRLEMPVSGADADPRSAFGIGDAYAQFVIAPYTRKTFAWVIGSGFQLPTANESLLGTGKWVVGPVGAPLWRFPRGLFLIKVQNVMSVGGDATRPDIDYLLITPIFVHIVAREWWVLADSETKTLWTDDGRTGVKSGLQIGRRIVKGVGLWVKPEVWWGANRYGRWNLKFGLVWYQRREPANRT